MLRKEGKNNHGWESFKIRNSLNNFACKLKKGYTENILNESDSINAGKPFKIFKRTVLPNKTYQIGIDSMGKDNTRNVLTDPKDIFNLFNSYFANIGESLATVFHGGDDCEEDSTKSRGRLRFSETTTERSSFLVCR